MKKVFAKFQAGGAVTYWTLADGRKVFLNRAQFSQMRREGAELIVLG